MIEISMEVFEEEVIQMNIFRVEVKIYINYFYLRDYIIVFFN